MSDIMMIANSPILWLFAVFVISIVVVQALWFLRMSLDFSSRFQILTDSEKRVVYKTAAINSIGPAVAVFFVAVTLIAMIGGPVTLMRIGVIGSAVFEFVAADQGAKAAGAELGTDSYTLQAFTASVWVMTLGGMGWLLSTFIMTKSLARTQEKMSARNPALIVAAGTATPIAMFLTLGLGAAVDKNWLSNIRFSYDDLVAVAVGAICMILFGQLGKRVHWLREWSVGISLIAGIAAGYFVGQMLT